MKSISVQAPAKLNLALAVTGVLPNGYHTVDMLMQTVDIYDRVDITKGNGYSLRCPGSYVPADDKNTATKAAAAFFGHTGLLAGADIIVHKKVPTRAGMAGGSADAAAVLVGLNELYGARLSVSELCEIGLEVGADVPFSIMGGTARVGGIGEKLTPLPALPECWFTVAMPHGGGNSTPEAYNLFDEKGSKLIPDIALAEQAIRKGDLRDLVPHMQNMLEESNLASGSAEIYKVLHSNGALATMMTGSGAAVFGLFDNRKAAQSAQKELKDLATHIFVASPVAHGPIFV